MLYYFYKFTSDYAVERKWPQYASVVCCYQDDGFGNPVVHYPVTWDTLGQEDLSNYNNYCAYMNNYHDHTLPGDLIENPAVLITRSATMSIKSWKAEFYPVPANEVAAADALEHSHKKWIGLLPENLKKHGLVKVGNNIVGTNNSLFIINDVTCALCQVHGNICSNCELQNCDIEYVQWRYGNGPKAMIALIERVEYARNIEFNGPNELDDSNNAEE